MTEEYDLINSSLEQTYTEGDHTVEICIYRMPDTEWSLEVLDEFESPRESWRLYYLSKMEPS